MPKCKICGEETRKGRQTCIGCTCIKEVTHRGNSTSDFQKDKATSHIMKKPFLADISWSSFFKSSRRRS